MDPLSAHRDRWLAARVATTGRTEFLGSRPAQARYGLGAAGVSDRLGDLKGSGRRLGVHSIVIHVGWPTVRDDLGEGRAGAVPAVLVDEVVRTFAARRQPPVRALDGVSLTIPSGEVHGLLGPNGAGKTTLMKILSTVLLPTSGRASICGHDVVRATRKVQPLLGIVFGGERGLYTRLSARQNLEYWGALYRLPATEVRSRTIALLDRMGLSEKADKRVETFSRGMKQRLHLARGLIGNASVLFLDEPTTGMDPVAAHEFRRLVGELRGEGRTILLATHDMAEAETLCDRVTLIDHGRIIATESPLTLRRMMSRFQRIDVRGADGPLLDEVEAMGGVVGVNREGDPARITIDREDAVHAVLKFLVDRGITGVATSLPSLEEVYLGLIGERGLEV
jgi:ABC-2 type transport system ATP-binding protein